MTVSLPFVDADGPSAITVDDLTVVRGGRPVLRNLSLRVPAGTVTGLLGPSGCGKTTLMRSIVGVQRVKDGTVRVLGQPAGSPSLRHRVSYVTQALSIYADLTVRENLRYFARLLGAAPRAVDRALATVGLEPNAGNRVGRLSGGQQARVSLASALLGEPELLVLDEPTVGQDPVLRRELWKTFAHLAAAGATVLISSHVMDEAEHCESLLLMRDGALLAEGTPAGLTRRTATADVEAAFLALVEQERA
jgi:ABC-2 type transport system ATP-binding protein